MNLKVYEHSTNYTASVIKLPVKQTVEGLDNLVKVEVFGNECLIGKDSDPSVLYLFFPAGCKISEAFLKANNLYRECQLNANPEEKGFFEPNGKVKGLKLRGVKSTGFVIPITSLEIMLPYSEGGDISELEVGDEFNEWCGVEVCRKHVIVQTQGTPGKGDKQAKINNKLASIMIPNQFRFHVETTHLAKNLHQLLPTDVITITDKWHGSSCILSRVYVNKKLNMLQKFINRIKFLPNYSTRKLAYIYASGKPKSNLPKGIEGEWSNTNQDFYNSNIWKRAFKEFGRAVEDGISLYGELVGFEESGKHIQKGYDYGCKPEPTIHLDDFLNEKKTGQYRFVIYRITYTKDDGSVIEFGWQQIKDYCHKHALEHVIEFYHGRAGDLYAPLQDDLESWRECFFQFLQTAFNLEKPCPHCKSGVPAEGIVLRIDGKLNKYDAYKVKSKLFVIGESNDEETNIEDSQ